MNIKKAIRYCNGVDKMTDNAILFFAPYFILFAIAIIGLKVFDSVLIAFIAGLGCFPFIFFWGYIQYKQYSLKGEYNLEWIPLEHYVEVK